MDNNNTPQNNKNNLTMAAITTAMTTSTASPPSSSVATIFSSTRSINRVPVEVWNEHICQKFLNLNELSILRRCHTFFEKYWQNVMAQNVIRVPQGCPTVEKAMDLAMLFSLRKQYTEADPLKIRLEEGCHEIVGYTDEYDKCHYPAVRVTCSHITFVGKGKDQTTIRGGIKVENQQHVKFEGLTITNRNWHGLYLSGSETNVDVLKCAVKECRYAGMDVGSGATVTATQCEFMATRFNEADCGGYGVLCQSANTKTRLNDCKMHHNGRYGLCALNHAVVYLHGTKTDIHSNKDCGIGAFHRAKVNIHLPSQHNTSHDNVAERFQYNGGSIANINADGTFTHAVVDDDDDGDY